MKKYFEYLYTRLSIKWYTLSLKRQINLENEKVMEHYDILFSY